MLKYRFKVCNYFHGESKEKNTFKILSDDLKCPVCNVSKGMIIEIKETAEKSE